MKKTNRQSHRNKYKEYKHMAFRQREKAYLHPTLAETQIRDIDHQIVILYNHLKAKDYHHYPHYYRLTMEQKEELRSEQESITMNISLMKEECSLVYESIGQYEEALRSLVEASQSLFEQGCDMLNSLMGHGSPHETRLYELDNRCKDLCRQHPGLWEQYRRSIMKYLLANQHLWPCE